MRSEGALFIRFPGLTAKASEKASILVAATFARKPSIELAAGDPVHQFVQRAHARAVGVRPEVSLVEQDAAQAGVARAHDIDVVQVANVNRGVLTRAATRQRDLEE